MITSKLIPLLLALAAISPTVAAATVHNPQSDAAMRKGIRDYAKRDFHAGTAKATNIKVHCVQAAKVGSTRPCSGTFSLTLAGRTADYRLTRKAGTFRISPGAIEYKVIATATRRAPGLASSISWIGILQ